MTEEWTFHATPPQDVYPGCAAVLCSECGTPSESGFLDRARRVWVCIDCALERAEEEAPG